MDEEEKFFTGGHHPLCQEYIEGFLRSWQMPSVNQWFGMVYQKDEISDISPTCEAVKWAGEVMAHISSPKRKY